MIVVSKVMEAKLRNQRTAEKGRQDSSIFAGLRYKLCSLDSVSFIQQSRFKVWQLLRRIDDSGPISTNK